MLSRTIAARNSVMDGSGGRLGFPKLRWPRLHQRKLFFLSSNIRRRAMGARRGGGGVGGRVGNVIYTVWKQESAHTWMEDTCCWLGSAPA